MKPLRPLRIPSRWAVIYNNFVDVDFDLASIEDRDAYFSQDLLSIGWIDLVDGVWTCPIGGMTIDVGWHETATNAGEYRLRVVEADWEHPMVTLEHRQPAVMARAVEICMERLGAGMSPDHVQGVLDLLVE